MIVMILVIIIIIIISSFIIISIISKNLQACTKIVHRNVVAQVWQKPARKCEIVGKAVHKNAGVCKEPAGRVLANIPQSMQKYAKTTRIAQTSAKLRKNLLAGAGLEAARICKSLLTKYQNYKIERKTAQKHAGQIVSKFCQRMKNCARIIRSVQTGARLCKRMLAEVCKNLPKCAKLVQSFAGPIMQNST